MKEFNSIYRVCHSERRRGIYLFSKIPILKSLCSCIHRFSFSVSMICEIYAIRSCFLHQNFRFFSKMINFSSKLPIFQNYEQFDAFSHSLKEPVKASMQYAPGYIASQKHLTIRVVPPCLAGAKRPIIHNYAHFDTVSHSPGQSKIHFTACNQRFLWFYLFSFFIRHK